jgi:UDP-glucuronate 4-epimerase
MAFSFHAQYGLQSLGMRFFTVYGPWGRPDMAPYLFAQAIRRQQPVTLFAGGELMRDFTFVDDTVAAVTALAQHEARWQGAAVVNVGHQRPIRVIDFVQVLSDLLQTRPLIEHAPMQTADVALTCASESRLLSLVDAWPDTPLQEGLGQFVQWLEGWDPLGNRQP